MQQCFMILRPVSAISFQEDDTFVVVFAFVHLAPSQCGLCFPEAESGAHPPHFLFARGSRGGRPRLRAIGTIVEHLLSAKCGWRDLLKKKLLFVMAALRGSANRPPSDLAWFVVGCPHQAVKG